MVPRSVRGRPIEDAAIDTARIDARLGCVAGAFPMQGVAGTLANGCGTMITACR